jgi:excisionase family DNA binding protein
MALESEHEKLLTPSQVAAIFAVDTKTITRWAKAGKLSSIRTLGGHRRYKDAEVRALLAGSATERVPDPVADPVSLLWAPGVIGVAAAARDRLTAAGITTVQALVKLTASELAGLGLRPAHVEQVRLALYRRDLALRGEIVDSKAA